MEINDSQPPLIKSLPEFLVNQIKAGEVVERPSTLLKELLENSLDAEADHIDIHIVDSGLELILVKDNGTGIPTQQIPKAFERHATSKIFNFNDLYRLHTYGFRGEALASIIAVANVTCETKYREEAEGSTVHLSDGRINSHIPNQISQNGTTFYIRELFANTPVRLKFLKSSNSEKQALAKLINSYLLSRPKCSFSVKWDDEERTFFPKVIKDYQVERLEKVWGREAQKKGIYTHSIDYQNYSAQIYFSLQHKKSGQGKNQFILVNSRPVQEPSLHQVMVRKLRTHWPDSATGPYLIDLKVPSGHMDVNVHPNKVQVKFAQPKVVSGLIESSLDKILENLKTTLPKESPPRPAPLSFSPSGEKSHFFHMQDGFAFFCPPEEGSLFLASQEILRKCLDSFFEKKESNFSYPLMISYPLQLIRVKFEEEVFKFLQEYGYEWERVSLDEVYLKNIPRIPFLKNNEKFASLLLQNLISKSHPPRTHQCLREAINLDTFHGDDFFTSPLIEELKRNGAQKLSSPQIQNLWSSLP